MTRFRTLLLALALVVAACGTTHAAGPHHKHVSRTAGVYIALVEHVQSSKSGIERLYADARATSAAGSQEIKPSGTRPISAQVQKEVRSATGVIFLTDPKQVIVGGDHVKGHGAVLTLGLVPRAGDHIVVGAGTWSGNTGAEARNYKLVLGGGEWRVVGDTGIVAAS